eukprot:scaffold11531_cov23-Prasinocladus_malaysianus.AAC.1
MLASNTSGAWPPEEPLRSVATSIPSSSPGPVLAEHEASGDLPSARPQQLPSLSGTEATFTPHSGARVWEHPSACVCSSPQPDRKSERSRSAVVATAPTRHLDEAGPAAVAGVGVAGCEGGVSGDTGAGWALRVGRPSTPRSVEPWERLMADGMAFSGPIDSRPAGSAGPVTCSKIRKEPSERKLLARKSMTARGIGQRYTRLIFFPLPMSK